MNIPKHFILSVLMVFVFSTAGLAQTGTKTPEDRAKALTEKMKTELTLTDDQYNKVYVVNLKYATKNNEIVKSTKSRIAKFKTLKTNNENKTSELESIFTEEQFKKYKTMQKELKEEAKEAHKNKKTQS